MLELGCQDQIGLSALPSSAPYTPCLSLLQSLTQKSPVTERRLVLSSRKMSGTKVGTPGSSVHCLSSSSSMSSADCGALESSAHTEIALLFKTHSHVCA